MSVSTASKIANYSLAREAFDLADSTIALITICVWRIQIWKLTLTLITHYIMEFKLNIRIRRNYQNTQILLPADSRKSQPDQDSH